MSGRALCVEHASEASWYRSPHETATETPDTTGTTGKFDPFHRVSFMPLISVFGIVFPQSYNRQRTVQCLKRVRTVARHAGSVAYSALNGFRSAGFMVPDLQSKAEQRGLTVVSSNLTPKLLTFQVQVFEQDAHAFTRRLHRIMTPGPMCYVAKIDALVVGNSEMGVDCYKYQVRSEYTSVPIAGNACNPYGDWPVRMTMAMIHLGVSVPWSVFEQACAGASAGAHVREKNPAKCPPQKLVKE